MKIKLDVDLHINTKRLTDKVRDGKLGQYAAVTWHRLYSPYTPFETGMLQNTVKYAPWEIEHTVPYAHRMYEGNFRFNKTYHPRASRKWDKAAEPTQGPKLIRELQAFVDKGGLKLGK